MSQVGSFKLVKKISPRSTGLGTITDNCLDKYFKDLGGMTPPPNLHIEIMSQLEKPLIEHVLRYVKGNQVRAAGVLGINRNTLRKKITSLGINLDNVK